MKQRVIFYFIFFAILSVKGHGQTDYFYKDSSRTKFAIGSHFGVDFILGADLVDVVDWGIDFKYIPNKFGVQISAVALPWESKLFAQGGLSLIYEFISLEKTTFYLYQVNRILYKDYLKDRPEPSEILYNIGGGLGIELVYGKHFGLNLKFGYTWFPEYHGINRKGELGLYYKF
ncbi:MAG: hypothetical protein PF448_04645 [Bacteroidales bacterium]|nr:hypothetical protein [Bacteroidales bacterium]